MPNCNNIFQKFYNDCKKTLLPVKSHIGFCPQLCTILIWLYFSNTMSPARLIGQKTILCGCLIKVQKIGAPVLTESETILTEGEVKVCQSGGGYDRQETISMGY